MNQKEKYTVGNREKENDASTSSRSDGRETREQIIECAGQLFARLGYDGTTSKAICEAAKVNLSAVNYHFGNRDNLYIAVLEEVQNRLLRLSVLEEIHTSKASAEEKLYTLVEFMISSVLQSESWDIELWVRELLTPSPFLEHIVSDKVLPKFAVVVNICSEYLGYDAADKRLYAAMLQIFAPLSLMILSRNHPMPEKFPVPFERSDLLREVKGNIRKVMETLRQTNSGSLIRGGNNHV